MARNRHRHFGRRFRIPKKAVIVFALLTAALMVFLELRLKPVISSAAAVEARRLAIAAMNHAVVEVLEETGFTGEELETVTALSGGAVSSVVTNTVSANKLKNLITLRSQEAVAGIRNQRINIPTGTILGGRLLNGTGPELPVYISLTGTVTGDFEETFESGGINQTVHKLSVRLTADVEIVAPLHSERETVTTDVLLGETVIVGNTPYYVRQ